MNSIVESFITCYNHCTNSCINRQSRALMAPTSWPGLLAPLLPWFIKVPWYIAPQFTGATALIYWRRLAGLYYWRPCCLGLLKCPGILFPNLLAPHYPGLLAPPSWAVLLAPLLPTGPGKVEAASFCLRASDVAGPENVYLFYSAFITHLLLSFSNVY